MTVRAEEYSERQLETAGWPVKLASYRSGAEWHCRADDVSPGATLCRTTGATREEAEQKALALAGELLGRTRRHSV